MNKKRVFYNQKRKTNKTYSTREEKENDEDLQTCRNNL